MGPENFAKEDLFLDCDTTEEVSGISSPHDLTIACCQIATSTAYPLFSYSLPNIFPPTQINVQYSDTEQ